MNGAVWLQLSALDVRVLRATLALQERTTARVAQLVGCEEDVAGSCLRRLRAQMLVEVYAYHPTGWIRTCDGDVALEHQS